MMRKIVGGLVSVAEDEGDAGEDLGRIPVPKHLVVQEYDKKHYAVYNKKTGSLKMVPKNKPGRMKKLLGAGLSVASVAGPGYLAYKHPEYAVPALAMGVSGLVTGRHLYERGDADARQWSKDILKAKMASLNNSK